MSRRDEERMRRTIAWLRSDPEAAFAVACSIAVLGPWRRDGHYWLRRNADGRRFGHVAYATRRMFERADAQLVAIGWALVGGIPDEAVPECGEVHEMTQGRPRLPRPSDPRLALACQYEAGHTAACGALHERVWTPGDDRETGECWWSAGNAIERRERPGRP